MSSRNFSAWSADGKPSRADLVATAIGFLLAVTNLSTTGTVSWGWAAVGFVAWAVSLGPIAASPVGRRVGAWFRAIGIAGRAIVIVAVAVAVFAVATLVAVPWMPVTSFLTGGFVAIFVVFVVEVLRDRMIPG